MAPSYPSRDQIAMKIFGRKFSQLSTDSKMYVNKTYGVMLQASRSGGDSDEPIRQAAFKETVSIVKQLKQILQNPGDVIELPQGVLQDAARVIHYQSQALGRGRVLNPKDMDEIRKEVKSKFKTANPEVVACIADYLTSTTGRFSGVGVKTLRRKLGSFLTKEQLEEVSNKEILSARDITIAHLFDKWSGGNLSSFVQPRLDELLKSDIKNLRKKQSKTKIQSVGIEEVKQTVNALEMLHKIQNSPSRSLSNPIVRRAMANLGLAPDQIVGESTKEALGEIVNATYQVASKRVKGHPSLGGGIRMSKNRRLHTKASWEYRESIPKSYPISGIGKGTTVSSRPYKHAYSSGWKWDIPTRWESTGVESTSSKLSGYNASEQFDFSSPSAESEYGDNTYGPWSKELQKKWARGIDAGPSRMNEIYTNLITKYAGSVTSAEERMGLSRHERHMHYQDISRYEQELEEYTREFGPFGKVLLERGINRRDYRDALRIDPQIARKMLEDQKLDSRTLRNIELNPDEFSPYSPSAVMAGLYGEMTPNNPVMKAVGKFAGMFQNDSPAHLPEEINNVIRDIAEGKDTKSGVRRVGVVGSKSFDNKVFMNKWMRKNWNDNMLMVTSTEVGKSPVDNQTNMGASFHASNWAHFNDTFQYRIQARKNKYGKNAAVEDVINASDEVVAFFDQATPDRSAVAQINRIKNSIGDKSLRIIWVPSDLSVDNKMRPGDRKSFGSLMYTAFKDAKNVSIEQYSPGSVPARMVGMNWKYLAKGGTLKTNESAIVGERGPEALIPDGRGGFNVIPNSSLRFLAEGTDFTLAPSARDVTNEPQADPHVYTHPVTGEVYKSVTEIQRRGKRSPDIAPYYGHVGSLAHYYAAQAMGSRFGLDVSHVEKPEIKAGPDIKGVFHSIEDIESSARAIADNFLHLADSIGFIPTLIERRFVDDEKKYSGTLDIGGVAQTDSGFRKVIADFKSSSQFDPTKWAEQIAAYAGFFEDSVDGYVINVTRDLKRAEAAQVDITSGWEKFGESLKIYHQNRAIPKSVGSAEDAAAERLMNMAARQVEVYDVRSKYRYIRQGIGAITPGHAAALSKIFPRFNTSGATPDETWDKNPSRLAIFSARMDEMFGALSGEGVHPTIKGALNDLNSAGWDKDSLLMLAHADMGSVEDSMEDIALLNQIYQNLKPIGFNQKLLDSGSNLNSTLWNDAIALLNILEESGKSFESMPRFPEMKASKSPSSKAKTSRKRKVAPTAIPGSMLGVGLMIPDYQSEQSVRDAMPHGEWMFPPTGAEHVADPTAGTRSAGSVPPAWDWSATNNNANSRATAPSIAKSKKPCPGVNLCPQTLNALRGMMKSTGGGASGKSTGGRRSPIEKTPIDMLPPENKWQKFFERLPFVGGPLQARRQWGEASTAAADYLSSPGANVEDYTKLLQKEDIARGKYYRSIRGATTSFLIAQHVMRVFGQTSQVFNKGSEAVGKGLGYISDMFLVPILPYLAPTLKGLVGIGNWVRSFPAIAAIGFGVGAYYVYKKFTEIKDAATNVYHAALKIPDVLDRITDAIIRMYPLGNPVFSEPESRVIPSDQSDKRETYWAEHIPRRARTPRFPGAKDSDTVMAMLTPGEIVIPKDVAGKIRGYADGGVVGGITGLIGGATGVYSSLISSDAGTAAIAGLGAVSRVVGAMMAPLAPVVAGAAIAGKGYQMLKNAIDRSTQVQSQVNQGGFGALRTMAAIQLAGTVGGLAPLLPIGIAIAGIYAWTQGFGPMAEGTLRGIGNALKGIHEWLKDRFPKVSIPGESPKDVKSDGKDGKPDKPKDAKPDRRPDVKEVKPPEEVKPKTEVKPEDEIKDTKSFRDRAKEFFDSGKLSIAKGVPSMGALGMLTGAMESNDPTEIAKSGIMGAVGQLGFNAIEKYVSPALAKGLGGFVAPEFAGSVAHAIVNGEGMLSPSNWIPGLKGNETVETGLRVAGSTALGYGMGGMKGLAMTAISDSVGGLGGVWNVLTGKGLSGITGELIKSNEIGNRAIGGEYGLYGTTIQGVYNAMQGTAIKELNAGEEFDQSNVLGSILKTLQDLMIVMKQPTINQNTFEVKSDSDWDLMQKIQDILTQIGYQSGAQRTG